MPDNSPTATPTITSTAMPRADSSSPTGSAPNSRSAFSPNFPLGCTLDRTLSSARSTLSAFEILEISDFFISPLPSHFLHLAIIAIVAIVHSRTFQHRKPGTLRESKKRKSPLPCQDLPNVTCTRLHAHIASDSVCDARARAACASSPYPPAHNRTAVLFQPYRQKSYYGTHFSGHTSKSRISEHTFKGILVKVALEYILFRIH